MLLDCGVRVSEACGLTVEGVDLNDGMALVKGTGSKVRSPWVPGPSARSTAVSARAQERWAHLEALFITQRGALSRTVPAAASGCAERPPASTGFYPHKFRLTFAHDYLMNGGQERDPKRLAGWSSDVMLERYGASAADTRAAAAAPKMRRGDLVRPSRGSESNQRQGRR